MRKRRRTKYTWFPVRGSAGPAETGDDFSGLAANLSVPPDGSTTIVISPMVPDVPLEGDDINNDAPGQLVQAIGQEYIVERIVGKCFTTVTAPADDPPAAIFPKSVLVVAGIFVARANDSAAAGGQNTPVGSASIGEALENYSPSSVDAIREPWMWRRAWVLNTGRNQPNFVTPQAPFGATVNNTGGLLTVGAPTINSNLHYGSVLDGPHVDVKSVRRIGNDERLWFVITARTLDIRLQSIGQATPNALIDSGVAVYFDYRVLGALRKAKNHSSF